MTYDQLCKVNERLATLPIKDKDYVLVNSRVMAFRELYPDGTITTELLSNNDGVCVMKASVCDGNMKLLATGFAYEKESSSFINKTSYIENCETSAVGRALGFLGIGIQTSIASAEEMQNAVNNQTAPKAAPKPKQETKTDTGWGDKKVERKHIYVFGKKCEEKGIDPAEIGRRYDLANVADMTMAQFRAAMDELEAM